MKIEKKSNLIISNNLAERILAKFNYIFRIRAFQVLASILIITFVFGLTYLYIDRDQSQYNEKSIQKISAVFLNNNQVYFGEIVSINETFITLTNVYYPKQSRPIQPDYTQQGISTNIQEATEEPKAPISTNPRSFGDFSIIKLGNEVHKPESSMLIPLTNINFIETLKEDSPIAITINKID